MKKVSFPYSSYWAPVFIGVLLLPIPLLGNFHFESALLAALIGCFWAGIKACAITHNQSDGGQIGFILRIIYLAGLPLLIFAIFTGCFSWNGLGFWILYPVPSVFFGYSFGRMLRLWQVPFRRWITVLFLLFVGTGILLIEFFNVPQVYFYNHVWGGWPGPIYDETIAVSWALVFFRILTFLWAALFWFLPSFYKSVKLKTVIFFCIGCLVTGYLILPRLGILSPRSYIQKQLGGVKQTEHFIIYYEKQGFTKDEIRLIALEHEFYFQQITEALSIDGHDLDSKIESYLYANVRQKNRLTGAKFTSYVPVWLDQDQLHIARQQLGSLKHELVHVLAKQFGNELLNASWSIGLVEGLAVALSGNISPRSTIHQIVAAGKPWPGVAEMRSALSLWGFYGGRSTVNYTTTGSFVRYLLKNYSIASFKEAYKTANIDKAYAQPFSKMVNGWQQFLNTVPVDSLDKQIAARLFSIPSIFEQACPHVLSPVARHLQNYRYYLTVKDTAGALAELTTLRRITPENDFVKNRWMFLSLKTGHINEVTTLNSEQIENPASKLLLADAYVLIKNKRVAQKLVRRASESDSIPYLLQEMINIRIDTLQWQRYLQLVYNNYYIEPESFEGFNYFIQIIAIKKAIERERWQLFRRYATKIMNEPLNLHFFGVYLDVIHYLGFHKDFELAYRLVDKLSRQNLKRRYKQRIKEQKHWLVFLNEWK